MSRLSDNLEYIQSAAHLLQSLYISFASHKNVFERMIAPLYCSLSDKSLLEPKKEG